ncbi:MAG: peroxiredoxin 2/4 [Methanolobus sp.]|nr:peroxiredoxin 2/4 [Methanolobus sp.]MDK2938658.1 peroxiredoxin 2/4 [Methanolobus sp.]MDK2948362.1 peroxiredoxin 2/4 [Methanolobus sp.]
MESIINNGVRADLFFLILSFSSYSQRMHFLKVKYMDEKKDMKKHLEDQFKDMKDYISRNIKDLELEKEFDKQAKEINEYLDSSMKKLKASVGEKHMSDGETINMPLIGDSAPSFTAVTTAGEIHFPKDYKGKWVILFSHPADFTPVCTTEFMTFSSMQGEFSELNAELLGLSIDSIYAHIAWLRTIKEKIEYKGMKDMEINFPVIADLKMEVAKKFGMVQPNASDTQAVRAVFMIDPKAKIRAIVYYPLSNGRNMDEIKRLLLAMQKSDAEGVATPANWQPGDDVIIPPPGSCGTAKERVESKEEGKYCLDWFMCFKKQS